MKISEILKEGVGLFSKEIKERFKRGQIELNGDVIKDDIDLDINPNFIMDLPNFSLSWTDDKLITDQGSKFWFIIKIIEKVDYMFGNDETNIPYLESLKAFYCLKIAKRESYILMKN